MNQPDGFIDPHGGFRELKSYQMSELEKKFLEQGGFTEKLYRTRFKARSRS